MSGVFSVVECSGEYVREITEGGTRLNSRPGFNFRHCSTFKTLGELFATFQSTRGLHYSLGPYEKGRRCNFRPI